ncbi:hypothetical protein AAU57_11415 [Nonlabens sp. YIK11]|nr:hypothetical protein AAU57_11415 [Nonlabens sp. YIK11]
MHFLEELRWKNVPICPYCFSDSTTAYSKKYRHQCNNCNTSFSVTVNTMFHKTRIDLQKWFLAIELFTNYERKYSIRELAQELNIAKDSALRMTKMISSDLRRKDSLTFKIIDYEK